MAIDRRTCLVTLAAIAGAARTGIFSHPAAAQAIPADGVLNFDVVRHGDVIGHHRFAFQREGDRTSVQIDVNVQVRRLGITLYRFTHRATEVWHAARLVTLNSTTHDDGTDHMLQVRGENGGLTARSAGNVVRHPPDAIPTNLWHAGVVERRALLHSLNGSVVPIVVQDQGARSVIVRGQAVATNGWFIDGRPDYRRWEWFDSSRRLVAVKMHGRDGSEVEYRLR